MAGDADKALPVLIAGGGIGGLAAGLALAATGRASHVLEQSSRFDEIGAEFRARFKYPYAVIYRADLHALLLEACQRSP